MSLNIRRGEKRAFQLALVDAAGDPWNPTGHEVEVRLGPGRGGDKIYSAALSAGADPDGNGLTVVDADAGTLRWGLAPLAFAAGTYGLTVWVDDEIATSGIVEFQIQAIVR